MLASRRRAAFTCAREMLPCKGSGLGSARSEVRSAVRSVLSTVLLLLSLTVKEVRLSESIRTFDDSVINSDRQQQDHHKQSASSVIEGWGLPDSIATVGRLFQYSLPSQDATGGLFTDYKVTAAGEEHLPSWLLFNDVASMIEGVPGQDNVGHIHNIQVTAVCRFTDGRVLPIQEYFTIKVSGKDDSAAVFGDNALSYAPLKQVPAEINNGIRFVRCRADASVTTATVIVDAEESSLLGRDRIALIRNLCSHLGLPVRLVRLAAMEDRHVIDASALVAGPGDVKQQSHRGLVVQWDVGCGNVYADHMPILELLELTSSNGTMGKAVGYGIVGWHITSKKLQQQLLHRRLKRQLSYGNPTATVMPTAARPTGRPVPTMTVSAETTDAPETRIVPTTTSRVETPRVRPTKSPVLTPTQPIVIPTRTSRLTTRQGGGMQVSTRSIPELEPSLGPTEKTVRISSTEALPRWTTTSFTDSDAKLTFVPPVIDSTLDTSIKPLTPRITRRPPKTAKPMPPSVVPPLVVSRPLEPVEAVAGNLLFFQIPDDTFTDRIDGGTKNLELLFLDQNGNDVTPMSWIKLNKTSHILYGLALKEQVGTHNFQLAAINSQGSIVKTRCIISVELSPASHKINHEFIVTIDLKHDKVLYDLDARINLINKIASAFGDKDASKMTITKISSGSVILAWTNNTLPYEPCPENEIRALTKYLVYANGVNTWSQHIALNESFVKAMEPYRILKAEVKPQGSCELKTSARTPAMVDVPSTTKANEEVDVKKPEVYRSSSPPLYILIPVIVFVVLLLILIIICMVCHKKWKRRQKEQEKLNGLHKGIPTILPGELEDKPETPVSTIKSRGQASGAGSVADVEGKQPVSPPEYPRSKPASQTSTLRSDYKSPLISDDDDEPTAVSAAATLPRKNNIQQQHRAESEHTTTTPLLHSIA